MKLVAFENVLLFVAFILTLSMSLDNNAAVHAAAPLKYIKHRVIIPSALQQYQQQRMYNQDRKSLLPRKRSSRGKLFAFAAGAIMVGLTQSFVQDALGLYVVISTFGS